MIDLMKTKQGEQNTKMTEEEIKDIHWNTVMKENKISIDKGLIAMRDKAKFEYLPDKKMENLDNLE